ncbi:MAG: DUF2130 domain-containing protein, partial [Erysipelotrichia bacterium]|nr:DUF2130 domain-containing protein [Erysipelotrichia bacterium]
MKEIKCPNCGEMFQIDESNYQAIVNQVRDQQFSDDLKLREAQLVKEKENALILVEKELQNEIEKLKLQLEQKDNENEANIQLLKNRAETVYLKKLAEKENKILELSNKLENKENENKLVIEKMVNAKDKEIVDLTNQLENSESQYKIKENSLKEKYESQLKSKDDLIDYYKDLKVKLSTKLIGETLEQHCENEFNQIRST